MIKRAKKLISVWLLVLAMIISSVEGSYVVSATEVENSEMHQEYPEIIPENLTDYYGYNLIGTYENGEEMQALYKELEEVCWEYYCADDYKGENLGDIYDLGYDVYRCGSVDISNTTLTAEEIYTVIDNFGNDNTIYYFMGAAYGKRISVEYVNDKMSRIDITAASYFDDDKKVHLEDYAGNQEYYRSIIEDTLHEYYDLTKDLKSDYEKEKAIYSKLSGETNYNHDDTTAPSGHNIMGVFENHLSVCEGFSMAYALILNYCGIDSVCISGDTPTEPHMWNAVKLDGEWFYCDLTWDAVGTVSDDLAYSNYGTANLWLEDRCIYAYFNCPAEEFLKSHTPYLANGEASNYIEYPECSNDDKYWVLGNYYVLNDPNQNKTQEEIIDDCVDYIVEKVKSGEKKIDFLFYKLEYQYYPIVSAAFPEAFERLKEETGDTYELTKESYGATSTNITQVGEEDAVRMITTYGVSRVLEEDEYTYRENNIVGGGVEIVDTTLNDKRLEIPSMIDGRYVTEIDLYDYYNETYINDFHLIVPDSVICAKLVDAKQVVLPEGIREVTDTLQSENTNGLYLPNSVKYVSIGMGTDSEGNDCVRGGYKIFGYSGSYAESYAEEHGIQFIDVTGKNLIDKIDIEDLAISSTPESFELSDLTIADITFTDNTDTTQNTQNVGEKVVTIQIKAKDGYAITPNTLVDVNGKPAEITNHSASEATISCVLLESELKYNESKDDLEPLPMEVIEVTNDSRGCFVLRFPSDVNYNGVSLYAENSEEKIPILIKRNNYSDAEIFNEYYLYTTKKLSKETKYSISIPAGTFTSDDGRGNEVENIEFTTSTHEYINEYIKSKQQSATTYISPTLPYGEGGFVYFDNDSGDVYMNTVDASGDEKEVLLYSMDTPETDETYYQYEIQACQLDDGSYVVVPSDTINYAVLKVDSNGNCEYIGTRELLGYYMCCSVGNKAYIGRIDNDTCLILDEDGKLKEIKDDFTYKPYKKCSEKYYVNDENYVDHSSNSCYIDEELNLICTIPLGSQAIGMDYYDGKFIRYERIWENNVQGYYECAYDSMGDLVSKKLIYQTPNDIAADVSIYRCEYGYVISGHLNLAYYSNGEEGLGTGIMSSPVATVKVTDKNFNEIYSYTIDYGGTKTGDQVNSISELSDGTIVCSTWWGNYLFIGPDETDQHTHIYDDNNVCKECGYKLIIEFTEHFHGYGDDNICDICGYVNENLGTLESPEVDIVEVSADSRACFVLSFSSDVEYNGVKLYAENEGEKIPFVVERNNYLDDSNLHEYYIYSADNIKPGTEYTINIPEGAFISVEGAYNKNINLEFVSSSYEFEEGYEGKSGNGYSISISETLPYGNGGLVYFTNDAGTIHMTTIDSTGAKNDAIIYSMDSTESETSMQVCMLDDGSYVVVPGIGNTLAILKISSDGVCEYIGTQEKKYDEIVCAIGDKAYIVRKDENTCIILNEKNEFQEIEDDFTCSPYNKCTDQYYTDGSYFIDSDFNKVCYIYPGTNYVVGTEYYNGRIIRIECESIGNTKKYYEYEYSPLGFEISRRFIFSEEISLSDFSNMYSLEYGYVFVGYVKLCSSSTGRTNVATILVTDKEYNELYRYTIDYKEDFCWDEINNISELNNGKFVCSTDWGDYIFISPDELDQHIHIYDSNNVCEKCGYELIIEYINCNHIYVDCTDETCDICGETRVSTGHEYVDCEDTSCENCGAIRIAPGHIYVDCEDDTCENACGVTRTAPGHRYIDCDDDTCEEGCGVTRNAPGHEYVTCVDTKCLNCGETRIAPGHVYDDCEDENCDSCGMGRIAPGHKYVEQTDGSKKCSVCGHSVEAPTTEEPTTEEPTTEEPTTEAPTTEAPTTEAPTTEAPTTEEPVTPPVEKPTPNVDVTYHTHIQTLGDTQGTKKNGEMAGTSGMAKRLENIWIDVEGNDNLGIQYTTHCQTYGWMPWSCDGESNGTSGEAKRLEAIMIQLTGADKDKYDVYYRVHAQSYGWLGWAKNGEPSGTAGYGKRLEGIQVVVVKKGETAPGLKYAGVDGSSSKYGKQAYVAKTNEAIKIPGNTGEPNVMYKTHVQTFGWQKWMVNGQMSGTSGKSKRLEGINIKLSNAPYDGDIVYTTHVQKYGWKDGKPDADKSTWKKNGEMSGTNGEAKRLEAICIDLTGEMAEHYDIYYRVHAQTFGWLGWAKNGEESGTAGYAKRLEGIQIVLVPKGGAAPADTYGGITSKDSRPFIEKK